jgi:hypothetical protein
MLGLDFAPASSAETDLNLARVVGRRVTQTEQNREWFQHRAGRKTRPLPFIDASTETAKPSSGNFRLFSTPGASKTVQPLGNGVMSGLVLLNIYARARGSLMLKDFLADEKVLETE